MSKKQKSSISGLLAKIDRIEKKLDLMNVMGKSMPVMILSVGTMVVSLIYLGSSAELPAGDVSLLPVTGDETQITGDFIILYPEHYSGISLPDEIIGYSDVGFYDAATVITFFAQKSGEEIIEIGKGRKSYEPGEYVVDWKSAPAGTYYLWTEIVKSDGTTVKSASIVVEIF